MFSNKNGRRIARTVAGLVLTGATGLAGSGHAHAAHQAPPPHIPAVQLPAMHAPHIVAPTGDRTPEPTHAAKPAPSATPSARPSASPHTRAAQREKRAASLRVGKTVTPNPMIIGAPSTYTVTVTNTGDAAAHDVTVTDTLDPNTTPGTLPSGCSGAGQTVTCGGSGTTVPAGGTLTYEIPVTVGSDVSDGTNVTNRAAVTSSDAGSDNTQLISQTQTLTDVEITKTGPATVNADGTITYTIAVTNHGPSDAVDVTVQDPTDGNQTTITDRPSECPGGGLTLTCPLGTLKPGETRTFTFTVKVNDGVEGTVTNCATVYTGSRESTTENNHSCTSTDVGPTPPPNGLADIHVKKSGPATVEPDGTITYQVVVSNDGDGDASNVVITDLYSTHGEMTGLPSGCADDGTAVTCSLGTIAAHDSTTLTFTMHVKDDTAAGTHVVNCAIGRTPTRQRDVSDDASCVDTVVEEPTPTPTPTTETPTPTGPTPTPTTASPGPTTSASPSPTRTAPGPYPTVPGGPHGPGGPGAPEPGHGAGPLPFTGAPLALLALAAAALVTTGTLIRRRARRG